MQELDGGEQLRVTSDAAATQRALLKHLPVHIRAKLLLQVRQQLHHIKHFQ